MVRRRQQHVEFRFRDPHARRIELHGCGSDGRERAWLMRRESEGLWILRLDLGGEEFVFRYRIDDRFWAIDGETRELVTSPDGVCRSQLPEAA
jgi:1,4-alpha-glucan branching enzyme